MIYRITFAVLRHLKNPIDRRKELRFLIRSWHFYNIVICKKIKIICHKTKEAPSEALSKN
jgi:hypothetical protein